jgi:hypothetical protein
MKYDYVIVWKLVDGTYETYKTPFASEQDALDKVKELQLQKIDTPEEWFSKPRSNAGIRDWVIVKTESNQSFLI